VIEIPEEEVEDTETEETSEDGAFEGFVLVEEEVFEIVDQEFKIG